MSRRIFKSIRWRIQIWHAAILFTLVAGFSAVAYHLARENLLKRVDQELANQIPIILARVETSGVQIAPEQPSGSAADRAYYVVKTGGGVVARSNFLPEGIEMPSLTGAMGWTPRTRGEFRESVTILCTIDGTMKALLIGRSVARDIAELNRCALLFSAIASGVIALGLAGGWWTATRAIRPIQQISAAAEKIAFGNLHERINVSETDSELGQLAKILNATFDRVQAAFDRQAQFTADASHELRTPISVVLAQTESTLARERPAAEYREALEACRRAARRLHQLAESLLELSRLDNEEQNGNRSLCRLDHVASDAVELLRPIADAHRINLETDLQPAHCVGNQEQLGQVVTNLLTNAIHYNRPTGKIRVVVTPEPGVATFTVSDTGTGIPEEDLPHIFERFFRADKSRSRANGRSGLGLAIASSIVSAHGGRIFATSRLSQGSTFTVRLPAPAV